MTTSRPSIAVLTSRFPYPLEKGDKLRLYHQIRGLATECEVHLIALSPADVNSKDRAALAPYTSSITTYTIPRWRRRMNGGLAVLSHMPIQVAYYFDRKVKQDIHRCLSKIAPDVIYCQLPRMAEYVREYPCARVIDYMDAFGIGMQRRAEVAGGWRALIYKIEAQRMLRYERVIYDDFDAHTIISEQDRRLLGLPDVSVVANGIDLAFFDNSQASNPDYQIGFVGNMGYLPNVAAADYLVHEVMPIIRRLGHEPHVLIAGARPDARVQALASDAVHISGWIEDIREAYRSINVFVAPIMNGTGQQNKILEAMAMRVPVITTPEVNEAIGAQDGMEIILAADAQAMAEAYDALSRDVDLRRSICERAHTFVHEKYTWEAHNRHLLDIVTRL